MPLRLVCVVSASERLEASLYEVEAKQAIQIPVRSVLLAMCSLIAMNAPPSRAKLAWVPLAPPAGTKPSDLQRTNVLHVMPDIGWIQSLGSDQPFFSLSTSLLCLILWFSYQSCRTVAT